MRWPSFAVDVISLIFKQPRLYKWLVLIKFQITHCRKIFLRICCTTKVQIQRLKKLFTDSVLYVSESKSNIDRLFGYSCLSSGNFVTKAWSLCLTRAHLYCICARNGQTGLVQSNHVCDSKYTWFYWEKIFSEPSYVQGVPKKRTFRLANIPNHQLIWWSAEDCQYNQAIIRKKLYSLSIIKSLRLNFD